MDSWNLQNIACSYKYLVITAVFLLLFFSIKAKPDNIEDRIDGKINPDNLFTAQAVFAFFAGFGGTGFVISKLLKINVWITLILAVLVGAAVMYYYDFWISKVQGKDKIKEADLLNFVNKEGKNKKFMYPHSEGQIELLIDEKVVLKNVVNNLDEEINEGEQIKIIKIENGLLFVERV